MRCKAEQEEQIKELQHLNCEEMKLKMPQSQIFLAKAKGYAAKIYI